jgi:type I restriction enzyme S subunit
VELVEDQLSVIDHLEAGVEAKLKGAQILRQSVLGRAFTGQLATQDPNEERASTLLSRIAMEREAFARASAATSHATKSTYTRKRGGALGPVRPPLTPGRG